MPLKYRAPRVIAAGALAALTLVGVSACGGGSNASSGGASSGDQSSSSSDINGKKVTLLTVTETCDYCARHLKAFKDTAEAAGLSVSVKTTNYDAAEQAQQVNQAIAQRPDAIVLWPADANAAVPSIKRIAAAKIPLVLTNSAPSDKTALNEANAFTGPNDVSNGESAAKAMVQGLKARGESLNGKVVVVIGQPGTPPAIQRLQGFKDTLAKEAPGLKIAATQPGNWDQTQATKAASALFTQVPDAEGVYAQADNMLAGAIVAAKRRGMDPKKVVFVGSNCSIEGVNNIKNGTQYGTVLQSPIDDGKYAADAVIKVLKGESVPKQNYLPHEIITKANVSDCDAAVK